VKQLAVVFYLFKGFLKKDINSCVGRKLSKIKRIKFTTNNFFTIETTHRSFLPF